MRRSLLLLLFALAASGTASAGRLVGDTGIPFSADRSVQWKGKTYLGTVEAMPGMQRHEEVFGAIRVVAILRADQQMVYLVLPDLHVFTKLPFPKAVTEEGDIGRLGKPVARGPIGGEAAKQYRVERTGSDGSALAGALWLSDDWIVLKADGDWTAPDHQPEHGTLELSNIRKAPQDKSRFELPQGYSELSPEAVQGLMSLRMPKVKSQ
jgi:hypothetical protein